MKTRHLGYVLALLCAPTAPRAQTAPQPDIAGSAAATSVETVIVSADRAPTPADQVGQSVTVLTTAQLRLDQETSVADILARTPGVSLSRNGGPGQTTSLFVRGAESDQTLVLIDGVKVNDPANPGSGFDFSSLLVADSSRVEVLRGPQSTLYGSEAIGGVVNIVTSEAIKPWQGDLQAEGGSYGTAYVNGAIGGRQDRFAWRLGADYNSTDSVSAFDRAFGGREADGFHSAGVSGRLRYDLTEALQLDQRAYYRWSRAEFDGYDTATFNFGDDAEFGRSRQLVDYTGLNLTSLGGRLKSRLAYEYSGLDRKNEDKGQSGSPVTFVSTGRANTVEYEGTFAMASLAQVVFGAQAERSTISAQAPAYEPSPTRAHAELVSGYAQLQGNPIGGLTLTGGVREDSHSTSGARLTGQASAAWSLNGGATIVRASFGQGFKAPSLYQLFSEYGNTALRPEAANGWDGGVEQHVLDGRLVLQATYFGRTTTNLIEFGSTPLHPGGGYLNLARARAEGLELQGAWRVARSLDLTANYSFDDAEDRSPGSATLGRQLIRRPKNTANFAATYSWPGRASTSVAVRYAGRSFDSDPNTGAPATLGSYVLVDLRASYPVSKTVEIYARLENLADTHYETAYEYGTLGRAAYAGMRLGF